MPIRSFVAAAVLLAAVPASAEDWEYMGAPDTYAGGLAVDASSIDSPTPSIREATVMVVLREDMDGLTAIVSRMTIDCPAAQKRAQDARGYDAAGALVESAGEEEQWVEMPEGTPYGAIHARVCRGTPYFKPERFSAGLPIAAIRARLEADAAAEGH